MIRLQKKMPQIIVCCAMALAIQNMNSTCFFCRIDQMFQVAEIRMVN